MSRRLSLLLAAALCAGNISSAFGVSFNVTGNDPVAKTLAPPGSGSETGTVTGSGDLNVSTNAVTVTITGGSGTRTAVINNSGRIRQTATGSTAARAIRNNSGAATINVINNAGALIQAADADAMQVSVATSNVSLDNSGSIIVAPNPSAGGNQAVDWNGITTGSNSLVNRLGGLLSATAADGVRPGVNGSIDNAGTIQAIPVLETPSAGVTQASSSDGIDAQTNSGVSVTNSGSITGRHGITGGATATAPFTISVTNQSGGALSGINGSGINIDSNGVQLGNATVINNGTITGNFDVAHYNTGDGDGVDVDGLCTLTNNGIIRGLGASGNGSDGGGNNPEGVSIGGGTVINNAGAEITGQNTSGSGSKGHGLLVDDSSGGNAPGATNITNAGLIRGFDSYGIRIVSTFPNTIFNDTTGSIRGGGNAAEGAAIQTTAGVETLTNRGAIVGDNGLAVDLGDGDDVMHVLGDSASITGDVSGGAGNNTLDFDVAGTDGAGRFDYSGALSNFSSVAITRGAVTFHGVSTYSGDTTISGGSLAVANSGDSATGTGTVIVQSGALLTGSGSVAAVDLRSGGTLAAPSSGSGNFSVTGDLRFTGGSQVNFQLGATAGLISVGGVLNFAGTGSAVVNITDGGIVPGRDYTLIRFGSTNAITASFVLGSAPPSLGATLELTPTALVLHSPAVSLSPASLNFSAQVVNTVSDELAVTITNRGTAPLTVGTPVIVGTDSSAFHLGSNGCVSPVLPNGTCTIGVRFAPTTSGNSKTASLSIPSNAGSSPDTVSLGGTAVDALYRLDASPASLDFGAQPVGTSSAPQAIGLTNTGNQPVAVTGLSLAGSNPSDFSLIGDTCSGRTIAVGESCGFNLRFAPGATGTRTASERIATNPVLAAGPLSVALSGSGTQPGIHLTPASLDFGSQLVGTSSAAQTVQLSNTGSGALSLTSISVSGGFAQSNNCGIVVAAGSSCQIDVRFTPASTGPASGTLTVLSDAPDGPVSAALSGTGIVADDRRGVLHFDALQATVDDQAGTVTLIVHRDRGAGGAASVRYQTHNLTALAGKHYTAVSGELTWVAGDWSDRVITVPITPDALSRGQRSFSVTLSNASGGARLGLPTFEVVFIRYRQ